MEARMEQLEKEIAALKSTMKPQKVKPPREPNAYNKFLQAYVEEQKKEPNYDHKKAFKGAAVAWGEKKKLKV